MNEDDLGMTMFMPATDILVSRMEQVAELTKELNNDLSELQKGYITRAIELILDSCDMSKKYSGKTIYPREWTTEQ